MIAALFVARNGSYAKLAGVDFWDKRRDARLYQGPYPVVAHPPCERWCRLAGLVEAQHGYKRGDDGGCFASALASVHAFGGVIEHPAYSDAWPHFGLPIPSSDGGWQGSLFVPGWSCYVEQQRYGHRARKATWLYAAWTPLPELRWGRTPDSEPQEVAWRAGRNKRAIDSGDVKRKTIGKAEASRTPAAFREILLGMARSARRPQRSLATP